MITRAQAQDLAEQHVAAFRESVPDLVLMPESTIERPFGWVFFYDSRRYIETGDSSLAVCGNAPVIVNRHTGELWVTGTAHPVERYIEEYEASRPDGGL